MVNITRTIKFSNLSKDQFYRVSKALEDDEEDKTVSIISEEQNSNLKDRIAELEHQIIELAFGITIYERTGSVPLSVIKKAQGYLKMEDKEEEQNPGYTTMTIHPRSSVMGKVLAEADIKTEDLPSGGTQVIFTPKELKDEEEKK